jgi:4-hydroxybenzoate polyprenyltransferase/phosphoglycolate phosphatase-like HAD superfamily hydrolase
MDTPTRTAAPLYVDLDGTLIATDLLFESSLQLLKADPAALFRLPGWLRGGKAALKHEIAQRVDVDVSTLPYREEMLELIRNARSEGRRVVLATASNEKFAHQVAAHLGLFDGVIGSDGAANLGGRQKLDAIVQDAGGPDQPFVYAGDRPVDLEVWRRADAAIVVSSSSSLPEQVRAVTRVDTHVAPTRPRLADYLYGLRLHQWLKNLLIALPMMPMLRSVDAGMLVHLLLAILAFGLMASSIYVVNDLLDLEADRRHPRKKKRPFASGKIDIPTAAGLSAALFAASLAIAIGTLPPLFTLCLLTYLALTLMYSVRLKRVAVVDVCVLAMLYTLRIIAGAAALNMPLSLWILSFSIFLFLSLALAKRYVEIAMTESNDTSSLSARGYVVADRFFVLAAGLANSPCWC